MTGPLQEATLQQGKALDPRATIWVEASAGSGKTKVLVDRCLRLLLDGTRPERLLCITFTKAAASEMANRLMRTLARWVALDPVAMEERLDALLGRHPTAEEVALARQLFALVLDTPGGLKVQTLHSFCQSILTRFPLEAGISPGFAALDERDSAELMALARRDLLEQASRDPALGEALSRILVAQGEEGLAALQKALTQRRDAVMPLLAAGSLPPLLRLAETLGLSIDADPEAALLQGLGDAALPLQGLQLVRKALAAGSAKEVEKAGQLQGFLDAAEADRPRLYKDYAILFLANSGAKRAVRKNLLTNKAVTAVAEALPVMEAEAERLLALERRQTAALCLQLSGDCLRIAETLLEAYANRKRSAGALDYQDLLQITADLLAKPGLAAWVLFKLDGDITHVLIDEAQDTSPLQWQILKLLTQEFYGGEGAHEDDDARPRSVFAVGDSKQSIYRFQGADPAGFDAAARHYSEQATAARLAFRRVELIHSFRSTPPVLAAVDAVFEAGPALTAGDYPRHLPIRDRDAGQVTLFQRHLPEKDPEETAWALPLAQDRADSPAARLADEVATLIAGWLGAEDPKPGDEAWLAARGRAIRAGDILILVRRRDQLFHMLARALERRRVPIAGIDRMLLSQQMAIMDLIALAQVLLLPDDDLSLASVLKGPLYGLDDESLYRLAHGRRGSLWATLRQRSEEEETWRFAAEELAELRAALDFHPPFELFSGLLGARGGRRRLYARLGEESGDPLDEFLSLALAFEREHVPSLQGFLAWLTRSEVEVKRDLEAAGEKVRLMTVHGAKGLQAPIVLLPDTRERRARPDPLLIDRDQGLLVQRVAGIDGLTQLSPLITEEREAAAAEERRLLYVAMTRAEDRLYLFGHQTKAGQGEGGWYDLLERGLTALCGEGPAPMTHANPQDAEVERGQPAPPPPDDTLPDWAFRAAPAEPEPSRPLSPSRPSLPDPPVLSPLVQALSPGLSRGRLVHRLLQLLPDLPADQRQAAALRFLAQPALGLAAAQQAELAGETLAVLESPEAAPLFGPDSRAEVPLTGLVGATRISGQIDRLAVTEREVLLVDYKTNRPSPRSADQVPRAYLQQLAAYAALLRGIYPRHRLHCFLLWTETARLMHISDDRLAQASALTLPQKAP